MKLGCIEAIAPGVTLKEKFDNLERLGFEGIELWATAGGPEVEQEIKEIAAGSRVKPCSVMVVNESFNMPLENEEAKRAKAAAAKAGLDIAAATGATCMLVPEYGPQLPPPILPLFPLDEAKRGLLLSLVREAADYAVEVGAILVIEPLNRYETSLFHTLDEAVAICREVGSPNLKIMADLYQMHVEERNMVESIKRNGEYIRHIHLSDSGRMLPGYGSIDFKSAFAALKEVGFDGYMVLECAIDGAPDEELSKCVEYLRSCMP